MTRPTRGDALLLAKRREARHKALLPYVDPKAVLILTKEYRVDE